MSTSLFQNIKSTDLSSFRPHIVHREGSLALKDWLNLSWAFPSDFGRERVEETSSAYFVYGSTEVYKFLKPLAGENLQDTISRAEREITSNYELAAQRYLGLRPYKWCDEILEWLSDQPLTRLNELQADGVAVVVRREETGGRLSQFPLERSARGILGQTALALAAFHKRRRYAGAKAFSQGWQQSFQEQTETKLEQLLEFRSIIGSYLDPVSRILIGESAAFLNSSYQKLFDSFVARGRGGFVVDCHGNLSADKIAYLPERLLAIFGRKNEGSISQYADLLVDVASLSVDLSQAGRTNDARFFEHCYFQQYPDAWSPEMYRYYWIEQALSACQQVLTRQAGDPSKLGPLLGGAFSKVLALPNATLTIFLGCEAPSTAEAAQDIVETINEMVDIHVFRPAVGSGFEDLLPAREKVRQILPRCRDAFMEASHVVMMWPGASHEEIMEFINFSESEQISVLLVDLNQKSMAIASQKHEPVTYYNYQTKSWTYVPYHLDLDSVESALYLLRELASVRRPLEDKAIANHCAGVADFISRQFN